MTRRFRLTAVLRARQAREDAARVAVAAARTEAAQAAEHRHARERSLTSRNEPDRVTALAFVAGRSALVALAADLSTANRRAGQADAAVAERLADLSAAAVRRRTVERLAERHAALRERAEAAAGQRDIDEIASGGAARAAQAAPSRGEDREVGR